MVTDSLEEIRTHSGYWTKRLYVHLLTVISEELHAQGISRSELARRTGAKPSWVTRFLDRYASVSLKAVARLAVAVGKKPVLRLVAPDEDVVVVKRTQDAA